MELHELAPIEAVLNGLRQELRALEERAQLAAVDDDGSLAETARMLALKRGCRR